MLFKVKQTSNNSYLLPVVSVVALLGFITLFFITENVLIPLLVLIPFVFLSLVSDYRFSLYLLIFSLPLSVSLRIDQANLNIGFPSEPLIGLLAIMAVLILFLQDKNSGILNHPLSRILFFYWSALLISTIFSSMFLVSVKTFIVSTAYLLVFYYLLAYYFLTNQFNIKKVFFLYISSLFAVVFYASWRHSDYAFSKDFSATVVEPFFSDHTIYGACLSFMVPISGIFYFRASKFGLNIFYKNFAGIAMLLFLLGVYFSHSRATWMSLLVIPIMLLILRFKLRFSTLVSMLLILLIIASFNMDFLMPLLVKNKNDSKGKRANLEEQIKSVTNIKNDVSNAERVNRWQCAVRMFEEKPFTGFGVGTYQFKYIPFQKGSEMTRISVTSAKNNYSQGMGGTAHSEYLLALSESGILSGFALLSLLMYFIYLGMKLYYKAEGEIKYYALMVMLGLLTYFLHAIFNNFLTTDKAAFLVWGSLACLVALDIKFKKK